MASWRVTTVDGTTRVVDAETFQEDAASRFLTFSNGGSSVAAMFAVNHVVAVICDIDDPE